MKTYEQVQDFYISSEKRYLVVSTDEKWYVKAPHSKNVSRPYLGNAAQRTDDYGYEIFPLVGTSVELNETYMFDDLEGVLAELNDLDNVNEEHIAISFEIYDEYGKDLDIERRYPQEETREEMLDNLVRSGHATHAEMVHMTDAEVESEYYEVMEFEDGDPTSHLVKGMKFKSVGFTIGLQKNQKLNI